MTETVMHIIGYVGTDIDHRTVSSGVDLSTFRLASTPRRFDRQQQRYVDHTTNWFSVQCWRSLAAHVADSVRCGDPVIVIGKLRTNEWQRDDGGKTSRFVVEATAVGHDLSRGSAIFTKSARPEPVEEADPGVEAVRAIEEAASAPDALERDAATAVASATSPG